MGVLVEEFGLVRLQGTVTRLGLCDGRSAFSELEFHDVLRSRKVGGFLVICRSLEVVKKLWKLTEVPENI